MEELEDRLERAQREPDQLNSLLTDYLPFLKGQVARATANELEYDDQLSLAMMTFVQCVRRYQPGRGGFLAFCSVSIRNRLVDESRKCRRAPPTLPLLPGEDEISWEREASVVQFAQEQERRELAEEIAVFGADLAPLGITLSQLAALCPKHQAARQFCVAAARELANDQEMAALLLNTRRVAQTELAKRLEVSPKTVEKHRKYIAAVALLLLGDYPGMRTFLPVEGGEAT